VKDVIHLGNEMMKKKDLVTTRVHVKEREARELAFIRRLKESKKGNRDVRFEIGMARLRK
jgi:hypothetical protein